MVIALFAHVGHFVLSTCASSGRFVLFLCHTFGVLFTTKLKINKILAQMYHVGVESFNIVILTGSFAGMVFALQSYVGLKRVGGEQFLGALVAMALIRELGPVLTGLMVTGRAGSAITAEIGTMRITEQIEALETLRINVYQYLIVPRIVAGTIIFPFLTLFAMFCGIVGGYIICVHVLQLSGEEFIANIQTYIEMKDIMEGLLKSAVFGFILTWVGTYKGYYAKNGAPGVGTATTQSVVTSSIMILIVNYFLTKIIEQL